MKKILFSLFAMTSLMSHAEFTVTIAPSNVQAGISEDDIESNMDNEEHYLSILLLNEENHCDYRLFQFNIFVPEEMFFSNDDELLFAAGERMPTTNKGAIRLDMQLTKLAEHLQTIPHYLGYQVVGSQQATKNYIIGGESGGELLQLYYGTTENLQDGIYPIYTSVVKFAKDENTGDVNNEFSTSYIKVGNVAGPLTMKGQIPSVINTALATETAITNLDLSAVTASYGTFTYVDGRAVTAPADENVKADKAVYSRTVGAGNYASLKAPFAATGCSNLYTLDNNSDNLGSEWVNFTEAATVTAGDNLLVKGDIALSAENVALGDVAAAHAEDDVYYVKNGIFYHGTNITINPLRTCWKLNSVNSNLMIAIDGEPTGITLNTIDGLNTPTYDLQGRRSEKAQHGIFVTNGKKQIIK